MATPQYVELHAKSAFSFLEGASTPEQLAAQCAEHGQHALGLTDIDGVYGSPRLHYTAKRLGIKALVGAEIGYGLRVRLPLLAETQVGYQNLCRLITRSKMRYGCQGKVESPVVLVEELQEHAKGLVCLTGGEEGPLAQALQQGGEPVAEARRQLELLTEVFGAKSVYVELQRHGCREQEARNEAIVTLANGMRLPLLATNGVRYADKQSRPLFDVLTCLRHKETLATAGRLLAKNSQQHLRRTEEMVRLFSDVPQAVGNTVELADRLAFTLQNLGYEFPRYPTPDGEPESCHLRKRTLEGALGRYGPQHPKAYAQIEQELALIEKLKLAGYFLIVWDIVRYANSRGFLVQGRGSAANSAVCYSLGITAVDPVGMGLLFERFLSEERGEWPDIDLDLPSDTNREEVIQYVFSRYGAQGAAMTANVITYRGRSAVRDVGKVLGFTEEQLGRLAAEMPHFEWKDQKDTMEKRFRDTGLDLADPRTLHFYKLTEEIMDLPRHLGQHSGGIIVCQGKLDQVVPIEPASMPNRAVVQWDKDDCADLGIVKIDLLGLGMLAVLQDCIEVIGKEYGELVDLAHLSQDEDVYQSLQKADTIGLFQVESRAQQAILPRMKPANFYDVVVQVAIIRPGPIVGQMLHPFLRRRQKLEKPESLHPWLDEVLARTLGVPLFQEQLLRMAMVVANFTGGEAEELRRAMGFKRSEKRMQEVEVKLRRGMTANEIDQPTQERIIQSITSFALYGFPESHAASFALIAYASAYLKYHYLAAFTICILNNQPMGFYSPATLIKDAQRHGQRFLPVDVTCSAEKCTIETREETRFVRMGFNYAKGIRNSSARAIVQARQIAPFASLRDLVRRVPQLNKKELSTLAQLGALNALAQSPEDRHRRGALWQVFAAARPVGELLESSVDDSEISKLKPMTHKERILTDFLNSGVSIGRHPMSFYRSQMKERGILTSEEAKQMRNGQLVRVAGCVICRQRPGTAKGFVFLSLEDEIGIVNVIVKPDVFDQHKAICVGAPYVAVHGTLQNTWNVISVKAQEILALPFGRETVPSHDFR